MKKLTRLLILMVIFSMTFFCLTSCNKPTTEEPNEKPDVEEPDDQEQDDEKPSEEKHVHEFDEWKIMNPATCMAAGSKVRDCKKCSFSERGVVEKLEHNYVEDKVIVEATCVKAGAKLFACSNCKDIKIENITPLGHMYHEGVCLRCEALENEVVTYTINYELNGGSMYTTSSKAKEGATIKLPNPTKENYIFEGWYTTADFKEDSKVANNIVVEENVQLYAKWDIVGYVVTLNPNGGYVETSTVVLKENTRFTLEVPSIDQYVFFEGWYAGEEKITDELGRGLKTWNISENVTLTAKYETTRVVDGVKFMYDGEYPQTVIKSEALIAELEKITEVNKRGYLEYNERQYAKYQYTGESKKAKFNDGTYLEKDKTYYFLVEPVLWRVLAEVEGIAIVEKIVDTMYFYESAKEHLEVADANPNNYEYSDISSWLNCDIKHAKNNFIYGLFADPNESLKLRKDIDNSALTTADPENPNACVTTTAYLYLLSYVEFMKTYDLRLNKTSKVTDYAIARGVNVDNYTMNGEWWLRSPSSKEINLALAISTIGQVFETKVTNANIGVRPVGTFKKIK